MFCSVDFYFTTLDPSSNCPTSPLFAQTVDKTLDELLEKNTGMCPTGPEQGRSFGELLPHFVLCGNETCLLASDGNVKTIGGRDKKKHEKNNGDSRRASVTM